MLKIYKSNHLYFNRDHISLFFIFIFYCLLKKEKIEGNKIRKKKRKGDRAMCQVKNEKKKERIYFLFFFFCELCLKVGIYSYGTRIIID